MRQLLTIVLGTCGAVSAYAQETGLSKREAYETTERVWTELTERQRPGLQYELEKESIRFGELSMRLLVKQFGTAPIGGASLYISMHGGGGAPSRVNDQQWRNQIRLYEPEEGYYVAPRAPTDTWNLWHEAHIDELLDRLILAYVVCNNVDPNRVYLMGYSAGGDGVFQLAPRLSDRFAAVAMMAGHPNETKPDGLRNVPFALFMGGKDSAYNRNTIAEKWKLDLAKLAEQDPGGYPHFVKIYPDLPHWMNQKDREALPWMKEKIRDPWPNKVVWLQDDVTHERLYWLGVPLGQAEAGDRIDAHVVGQTITIRSDVQAIRLFLNDRLLDLDQPIKVRWNESIVFEGAVKRNHESIEESLKENLDKDLVATAIVEITSPR
jgi:pimeloyl-ACP methyl ester carboxylesterase